MGLAFQVLILSIIILNLYSVYTLNKEVTKNDGDGRFIIKPIIKSDAYVQNRRVINDARRHRSEEKEEEALSSSSMELPNFKKEWRDVYWLKKQYEVIKRNENKSALATSTDPDVVNMIAARPWGVRCGDPTMHDMPWGTCMLPMECEPAFRIFRGDYFCGRTQFVCCAIEETSYDLYKGFDASFASSFETDTEERKAKDKTNYKDKNKASEKKRRENDRKERKRIMRKKIKEIIKQVRKLLNRIYNNGTKEKRKKTKQMKQFIKELKAQYKKDRQAMKDIHEIEYIKIDAKLKERLEEIMKLNVNFMRNATFREVILNGNLSLRAARMLVEAYPDLESYFGMRRSMSPSKRDYMDYDVEYGLLYS